MIHVARITCPGYQPAGSRLRRQGLKPPAGGGLRVQIAEDGRRGAGDGGLFRRVRRLRTGIDELTRDAGWLPVIDVFPVPGGNGSVIHGHAQQRVCS